jgi:preprotein translocase subunit SecY
MTSVGRIKDLREKVLYTFLLLLVFRFVAQIPVPGVDTAALRAYFDNLTGSNLFDVINTFSGGSFKKFTVLALGIMPYITTSIVFSLLGEVVPYIAELQEDADGYKTIQKMTRYFTVLLCLIHGYFMVSVFQSTSVMEMGFKIVPNPGLVFNLVACITLTAGTMFLLWLGERITEYGLENGVSLIIFAGIAVELPAEIINRIKQYSSGEVTGFNLFIYFLVIAAVFFVVSFIEKSYRSIPVQYAKRMVNNRMYGGTQTLPIRLDTAGVMPPILAYALLSFPSTIASFLDQSGKTRGFIEQWFGIIFGSQVITNLLVGLLIWYMTFFYAPIQFKTNKVAEMLQKNNAFIPGIRPGGKTKEYLDFVLLRLSFFCALFLVTVCLGPGIIMGERTTRFSGTSMLILVSVAIRVIINVQSFLFADRYNNPYRNKGKYSGGKRRF